MEISAETLIGHQLAYTYLGKAFYESPTLELIQAIVADNLFADWPLECDNSDANAGLQQLADFSAQWNDAQFGELRRDYARLFIGPNRLLAPPWESVYRSIDHVLFERQTLEVRQQYQRYHMPLQRTHVEPEDHIGLELRFVAHLNGLALFALEQGDTALRSEAQSALAQFLSEHLLQWSPEFLERVVTSANTAYYRGIAQLTLGCLDYTAAIVGVAHNIVVNRRD